MASDGLWDHISGMEACRSIHASPLLDSPQRLMQAAKAASNDVLSDDISILVLDLMPHEGVDFSQRPSTQITVLRSIRGYLSHPGKLKKAKKSELIADEDGLITYPDMSKNLIPEICDVPSASYAFLSARNTDM